MSIPVRCPTALKTSSSFPASLASIPNAASAFCVLSIDVVTSTSLTFANFRNCPERSSSSFPVTPKRVLTSPTAFPMSSKSAGISVPRFLTDSCIAFSSSPVAPVFLTTASMPLSTSLKATIEAVPNATSGTVTFFVRLSPIVEIFFPTLSNCLPRLSSFELASASCCALSFLSSCSVAMISLFSWL